MGGRGEGEITMMGYVLSNLQVSNAYKCLPSKESRQSGQIDKLPGIPQIWGNNFRADDCCMNEYS